jgi:hypothetical protein
MRRIIVVVLALVGIASPALSQIPQPRSSTTVAEAPEKLLSPTTQLYIRWDGITAHNEAYKKSFWGGLMAGPTGSSLKTLIADWPNYLGSSMLAEPLLEGKPPEELKKALEDLKSAGKLIDLISEKGLVLGVEVRKPQLTFKGIGQVADSLIKGEQPGLDIAKPDVEAFVIVPDVGEKAEVLFAALRLVANMDVKSGPVSISGRKGEPFTISGRTGFRIKTEESVSSEFLACWVEGRHFVFYSGSSRLESAVATIAANAAKGGITNHALFHKCKENPGYESVCRGFVDTGKLISLARNLVGPFVPGLGKRLDDLGISNLKSITFNSGFDGKVSRGTYDFNLAGELKGLARIIKREPLGLKDLPSLPPDVSRFSALRIDPTAAYETATAALEMLSMSETANSEDGKNLEEKIAHRREYLMKEADKQLGVNLKDDLLPHLGDKLMIYNSPSEGISVMGTVVCLSLKDPAKVKTSLDRIQKKLETFVGAPVKIRKKMLCGVEIRELYSQAFLILTPTYSIVGDWLVFSLQPQPVQGFILRSKGEIPAWKPDAATAAQLAKLPADACSLQFCDPRATVTNLACVGPAALGALSTSLSVSRSDEASTYEPIDIGLLPNAHELNKHLFPNLTVMRNDGKTIRIEVNESFSLPLEFIGIEAATVGGYLGLLGGFLQR